MSNLLTSSQYIVGDISAIKVRSNAAMRFVKPHNNGLPALVSLNPFNVIMTKWVLDNATVLMCSLDRSF